MLDVRQCTLFVQLAQIGSVSRAARILGKSPPVLSRQLAALEAACGAPLFYRTGRGTTLSEFGRRLLPIAQQLVDDARKLEVAIRNASGKVHGQVQLGMLPAAADPLLTMLLGRLEARHPDIHLRVVEGNSGQLERALALGLVDVTLLVRENPTASGDERLLSLNPLQLFVPHKDAHAGAPTITFRELQGLPLIMPGLPNHMREDLARNARQLGFSLNVVFEIDSLSIQRQLLSAGLGYVVGSRGTIPAGSDTGIAARTIVDPVMERGMVLTASQQTPLTLAARVVLNTITEIAIELRGNGIWQLDNRSS